ncbi:hypothetical protein CRG98_034212 [Punica granatum]|uniref:Uncharacterized protein n=1 Tax=Punica granatum TaxID=22663 RepID=A0A2I0IN41_PUNGR|nr:hypothetical protein CRG98_034212 [Punica granatum]
MSNLLQKERTGPDRPVRPVGSGPGTKSGPICEVGWSTPRDVDIKILGAHHEVAKLRAQLLHPTWLPLSAPLIMRTHQED